MTIRELTDWLLSLPTTYGHLEVIIRVGDLFASPCAFVRPTSEEAARNDPPALLYAHWPDDVPPIRWPRIRLPGEPPGRD